MEEHPLHAEVKCGEQPDKEITASAFLLFPCLSEYGIRVDLGKFLARETGHHADRSTVLDVSAMEWNC